MNVVEVMAFNILINHRDPKKPPVNYPVGMSDCEVIGLSGNCGDGCPMLERGECKYMTKEQIEVRK